MKIEVLVDVKTTLGEGPVWDVEQQRLYWIDAAGMRIFRATAQGTEIRAWDVPSRVGSIAIRKDGKGAICSLAKGFHSLDFATGEIELIAEIEIDRPHNWINDGKVDRRGRFFAARWDSQEAGPNGALYRLDPDFSVTLVESGIIVSNGPCWSPDDKTFYFADTWAGEIWAYDYDMKLVIWPTDVHLQKSTPQRVVLLTVLLLIQKDVSGMLWSMTAGSCVTRPMVKSTASLTCPVKKITSAMFGGPNLDILYVTSMAKPPLPRFPGDGQLRGSLFAIHGLGIKGIAEPRFGA